MSTQEQFIQQFARLFNHYNEALSPDAQCNEMLRGPAAGDKHRLVQAARLAILELEENNLVSENRSRYFAKPGEAEWGC